MDGSDTGRRISDGSRERERCAFEADCYPLCPLCAGRGIRLVIECRTAYFVVKAS
jgi:hypothetical protein